MIHRKSMTGDVISRLQDAEHFLKLLRRGQVLPTDPRVREWSEVTRAVFYFAFGELSPLYRDLQVALGSAEGNRGLHSYPLARCLYLAKRSVQRQGLMNGEWPVTEDFSLPDYLRNRGFEREETDERCWWTLFWSFHTFDKYKL